MKFLIIHNRYSRTGGEEGVVATQQRLLAAHGHEVRLYERSYDEIRGWRMGKVKSFFTSLRNKRAVRDIERVIADFGPDVAIVHNLYPVISPVVLPALHKAGVRVLMTVHNYRLVCPTGLFFTRGEICERCGQSPLREWNCLSRRCEGTLPGSLAYALRNRRARVRGYYTDNVDRFLALSDFQRDKLTEYGLPGEKFGVIPNCIDPDSMPASDAVESDFVGYVGRLSVEKGVDLLFETAGSMPHIKFKVAGEAAEGVSTEGMPANIELMGLLTREQLADFYRSARVVILPSICYEGFPLSVIEAMYYGRTVAVPDIGALGEIVDHGECGMLFRAGDRDSLAAAIEALFHDKGLRDSLGAEGRRRVVSLYNSERYYTLLMALSKTGL